jgi:hypothetical protein
MTTTVLTMTLTGLASDSSLAGGNNRRAPRRALSAIAMFVGAVAGAALYLHRGAGLPLALGAGTAALTAIATRAGRAVRTYLDQK